MGYKEELINKINIEQLSHAYIFEIDGEENQIEYAKAFAKLILNKENSPDIDIHIDEMNFRDLFVVQTEKKVISIDLIREMIAFFQTRPFYKGEKLAIIIEADKLKAEGANAMLKTLEEPQEYGKIVLLTSSASKLLPTIISRSEIVRLKEFKKSQIDDFIKDFIRASIQGDFLFINENREKIEAYKEDSEGFFLNAANCLNKIKIESDEKAIKDIDDIILKTIEMASNFKVNANFMLSVEYFMTLFI